MAGPAWVCAARRRCSTSPRAGWTSRRATPYLRALGSLWNLGELTTVAAWNTDYSDAEQLEKKIADCVAEGLRIAETW